LTKWCGLISKLAFNRNQDTSAVAKCILACMGELGLITAQPSFRAAPASSTELAEMRIWLLFVHNNVQRVQYDQACTVYFGQSHILVSSSYIKHRRVAVLCPPTSSCAVWYVVGRAHGVRQCCCRRWPTPRAPGLQATRAAHERAHEWVVEAEAWEAEVWQEEDVVGFHAQAMSPAGHEALKPEAARRKAWAGGE